MIVENGGIFHLKILPAWTAAKAVKVHVIKEEIALAKAGISAHGVMEYVVRIAIPKPAVTSTGNARVVKLVSMVTNVRSRVVRDVLNATKTQELVVENVKMVLLGKIAKVSERTS